MNSRNVFKQVFVVLKRHVIKKFYTYRVVLFLVLWIFKLFITLLHLVNVAVINSIADIIHEDIKHDVTFISFTSKLEWTSIMRSIHVRCIISIIKLKDELLSILRKVIILLT